MTRRIIYNGKPKKFTPVDSDVLTFERQILWEPGYDFTRDPDPDKRRYGCHGLQIRFLLHGPKASVQFLLFSNWLPTWKGIGVFSNWLPTWKGIGEKDSNPTSFSPLPADVGYHSDAPLYEGQEPSMEECPFRENRPCYYYNGFGMAANKVFKLLVTDGAEAVWGYLEERYKDSFS